MADDQVSATARGAHAGPVLLAGGNPQIAKAGGDASGESNSKDVRYLDIHEDDQLDDGLLTSWIRQAAELRGWIP